MSGSVAVGCMKRRADVWDGFDALREAERERAARQARRLAAITECDMVLCDDSYWDGYDEHPVETWSCSVCGYTLGDSEVDDSMERCPGCDRAVMRWRG